MMNLSGSDIELYSRLDDIQEDLQLLILQINMINGLPESGKIPVNEVKSLSRSLDLNFFYNIEAVKKTEYFQDLSS